jgi:hypothetical protein
VLLIRDALQQAGDEVTLLNCNNRHQLEACDLVWLYGDEDNLGHYVNQARIRKVPLLLNSAYDASPARTKAIVEKVKAVDKPGKTLLLAVFSEQPRHDPALGKLRHRIISIPKTIRPVRGGTPFGARSGICLGDAAKTFGRPKLVRGIDPAAAVAALRSALPSVPLYVYGQYGFDGQLPQGVELAKPGDNFVSWLGTMRLFVSLASYETFAMVPTEAQGVGTPVLYRHMPQGLSAHLNHTGVVYSTPAELGMLASQLYGNRILWDPMSTGGIANAKAHALPQQAPAIHLALRKAILAHKGL